MQIPQRQLTPFVSSMRRELDRWFPPRVVSLSGGSQAIEGASSVEVVVPNRASIYFLQGLTPLLLIMLGLQFSFAGILCAVQAGLGFGPSFYHLMMTSTTVGLGGARKQIEHMCPGAHRRMAEACVRVLLRACLCVVRACMRACVHACMREKR